MENNNEPFVYATGCSGIEAPSVAFEGLGWTPAWFSEVEEFPCAVLKHRFPHVPNLGDMNKLLDNETFKKTRIDLLAAGTPCQSFSLAGLRGGMVDERGNLALTFCRLLIAKRPSWFIWENVPGVFSSFSNEAESADGVEDGAGRGQPTLRDKDVWETSDFATLLTAFRECGYSCCWRVLDSQYFGVPQRRRRVFVVGYFGDDWRPPFAVLFERESLRGDITPGRPQGETVAALTANGVGASGADDNQAQAGHIVAYGGNNNSGPIHVATAVNAKGGSQRVDPSTETLIVVHPQGNQTGTIDASYGRLQGVSGQDTFHGHSTIVAHQQGKRKNEKKGKGGKSKKAKNVKSIDVRHDDVNEEIIGTLLTDATSGWSLNSQNPVMYEISKEVEDEYQNPVVYDTTQITSPENRSNPQPNDPTHTLSSNAHPPLLKADVKQIQWASGGGQIENDTAQALRSDAESNYQFIKQPIPINTMTVGGRVSDNGRLGSGIGKPGDPQNTITSTHHHAIAYETILRRLTPLECERLQGFPDNWTNVPWKGSKTSTDGHRYRSIGNSMTTHVMKWIGTRIKKVNDILKKLNIQNGK